MALDKAYMSFGLNLAQGFMANQETKLQNQAIEMSNAQRSKQAYEQQGYAATNYSTTLEELKDAELQNAVAAMVAEGAATVNAAMGVGSREEADLQIARDAGRSQVAIGKSKQAARVNYKNQAKAIEAQRVSGQTLRLPESGILEQVLNAGSQTYFQALKAGIIK